MKKHTFIISLLMVFFSCKEDLTDQKSANVQLTQHFTMDEVKSIAAEYGVTDINEETNTLLPYLTRQELETMFKKYKHAKDFEREYPIYMDKTKEVRCLEDDLKLIKSLPAIYEANVNASGGEEKYQTECEERLKVKWHIYRNNTGFLQYYHPLQDDGSCKDERLDNKQ